MHIYPATLVSKESIHARTCSPSALMNMSIHMASMAYDISACKACWCGFGMCFKHPARGIHVYKCRVACNGLNLTVGQTSTQTSSQEHTMYNHGGRLGAGGACQQWLST
eukprot:351775-Chlamydomonas_euryale.AAC.7